MGDPAPPRRRTHGEAGARALALVKPLPPKAVAGRPALQGSGVAGYNRHWRTDGQRIKTTRSRQASSRARHHPFEIQKSAYFTERSSNYLKAANPMLKASWLGSMQLFKDARRRIGCPDGTPFATRCSSFSKWNFVSYCFRRSDRLRGSGRGQAASPRNQIPSIDADDGLACG